MTDINDRPEPGKVYALTGSKNNGPSMAAGNTWAESEVVADTPHGVNDQELLNYQARANPDLEYILLAGDTIWTIST